MKNNSFTHSQEDTNVKKIVTRTLLLCCSALLLTSTSAFATTIAVGTPGDSETSPVTGPSPRFGNLTNFDALPQCFLPCSVVASLTSNGILFSSPDGLSVESFSTQSGPNYLVDTSADGSASLTIRLFNGVFAIGVGIADSDPVSVTFQAINSLGAPLGAAFVENLATTESLVNTGNGYYVVSDTTADIYGLQITQAVGDPNGLFSGLAIDDVQVAPEPASAVLLLTGISGLIARKRLGRRR